MTQTENRREQTQPSESVLMPPVDVFEDAAGITLVADLPGAERENLHLRVEGETLTIEAGMTLDMPAKLESIRAEVGTSQYRRVFTLSRELDVEKISAHLNQGVLRVRLPKAAHAQPRKIAVEVG